MRGGSPGGALDVALGETSFPRRRALLGGTWAAASTSISPREQCSGAGDNLLSSPLGPRCRPAPLKQRAYIHRQVASPRAKPDEDEALFTARQTWKNEDNREERPRVYSSRKHSRKWRSRLKWSNAALAQRERVGRRSDRT